MNKVSSGISPIVYHATGLSALESILSENRFKLSASIGTSSERKHQKKNKFYYLSTTRNKLGSFNSYSAVILVLDGRKLGQNYIGDPIDYWGEAFRKVEPGKFEAEDRVWSEKQFIEPATKYIKEIHILWDDREHHDKEKSFLRKSLIESKKAGIQTFLYGQKKPFTLLDSRRAISLTDIDLKTPQKEPGYQSHKGQKWYKPYLELYYENDPKKLSEKARRFVDGILGWWKDDGIRTLGADIHNNKSKDIKGLVEVFQKEKISTPTEFVELLIEKWKPILR